MAKARKLTGASVFRYLRKQAQYIGVPEDIVNSYKVLEVVTRMGNWNAGAFEYSRVREMVIGILRENNVPRYQWGGYIAFAQEYYKAMKRGAVEEELAGIVAKYGRLSADVVGQIRSAIESAVAGG